MIYREYLTEYSEYDSCIKHSITISTDSHRVFKTIFNYCANCGSRMTPYKGGEDECQK